MTDEDKKRISECMGWKLSEWRMIDGSAHVVNPHFFDLNDAALCVQEMQKRGEFKAFLRFSWALRTEYPEERNTLVEYFLYIFNPDNFFTAMSQWIKERKK